MKIENMTIHGGNQQFSNLTGLEQDVIDALTEQAKHGARVTYDDYLLDHSKIRPYPGDPLSIDQYIESNWTDYLTPKAKAMISKMQELINTQP